MYDVVHMAPKDGSQRRSLIASGLSKQAACELARSEARRRNVGRMFLAGSEPRPDGEVVLIVDSVHDAA